MSESVLCVICGIDEVKSQNVCSLDCARLRVLCTRLKRIEDVLVEIKYEIKQ